MRNYRFFKNNNNTKIASRSERVPFKWAGAKNRMFNKYISRGFFLKKEPKLFVDMFAGTGTVGKWVAENYPNTTVVLNETCDELMHMYKQLKAKNYSNFEKEYLKHAKAYAAYSSVEDRKKYYYNIRNQYALAYHNMSPSEEAAALFYMLQTGFNGIWQTSDNFNNRYASPAGLMTWKPAGELFNLNRIKEYSQFIDRCVLLNDDFESTSCFIGSDTWFYADPPYRVSKAKYKSAGSFTTVDQVRLCNFLKDAHTANDMCSLSNREDPGITYDDEQGTISNGWFANKFNDDWNVSYYKVKYTAGRHNKGVKGNEVLIKNY